jgi:hypothetical protein
VGSYNDNVYSLGNTTPTRQLTQRSLSKPPSSRTPASLSPSRHLPNHRNGSRLLFFY